VIKAKATILNNYSIVVGTCVTLPLPVLTVLPCVVLLGRHGWHRVFSSIPADCDARRIWGKYMYLHQLSLVEALYRLRSHNLVHFVSWSSVMTGSRNTFSCCVLYTYWIWYRTSI